MTTQSTKPTPTTMIVLTKSTHTLMSKTTIYATTSMTTTTSKTAKPTTIMIRKMKPEAKTAMPTRITIMKMKLVA